MIASISAPLGIAAAIAEIKRRHFDAAEARLAQKMQPARVAPIDFTQLAAAASAVHLPDSSK